MFFLWLSFCPNKGDVENVFALFVAPISGFAVYLGYWRGALTLDSGSRPKSRKNNGPLDT